MTVIGLGNIAMGDDGIGVEIAGILSAMAESGKWPRSLEVIDAAEDAALAGACVAEGKDVLVVDAVEMKREPGSWRVFSALDLTEGLEGGGCSTHAMSLAAVIEIARALGCADRLRILGIQAADVRPGRFLSPHVRQSVPEVIARIREEVEALS